MIKRLASLVLAIAMLLQILVPQTLIAKEEFKAPSDNLVKVGLISGDSYDSKLMLELNRLTAKNRKKGSIKPGTSLFGYFEPGNEPKDENKLKYHGEVKAKLTVNGIDGGEFPWNDIFGSEEVHLRFIQINENTSKATGIERVLNISKGDTYAWTDGAGNPAELPLFNNNLEPLKYEVKLDEEVSDKVKLLTARITSTNDATSPTFEEPDSKGRIKYHLTLELTLQQVASTKFKSEWHTDVEEAQRPGIEASFIFDDNGDDLSPVVVKLPKNDSDTNIIRDWEDSFEEHLVGADYLYKTPTVEVKTDTSGLTFEENNGVKTVKAGDHKYKYDFTYDVINGGKLTMTEIIPLTFDANGGKFDSITDPAAEQKIVKEVEYDKDLADKPQEPKKDLETFKGWGIKDNQGTIIPVTDAAFKNIKEAKTFYAIWDNNDIQAEELEVKESFKDGNTWVNDFIPTLDQLKAKVKIKDASGTPQALTNDDTFAIVDGTNEYTTDAAAKDYLYNLLKEDDATEVSRKVTLNAKITHKNGTSQTIDIPIKVIKNIYEAKTEEGRPVYVPTDYVKVTVDPTTKAEKPQKYFYYVNPKANVVIPGKDPVGTGENKFTKWLIKGTTEEYKLADKPRHMFTTATTIEAQYVSDVIPANPDGSKPDTVPSNFVSVTFKPTDNATDKTDKIYWVNREKDVTIPVDKPVGKEGFTFKEWKMGADAKGERYIPSTPKKFTDTNGTIITATYDKANNIIPYDPNSPITRPKGYIRVKFEADKGLELENVKFYYVKMNAKDAQGNSLTLGNLTKPTVKPDTGYELEKWDKLDTEQIAGDDIVVTAKAKKLDKAIPEKDDSGTPNKKPKGYKEVTFVVKTGDEAKGSLSGTTKYYVNPKEYVTLTPPTATANTGYEFGAWDKDANIPTVYEQDTIITASFNSSQDLIPKFKDDGTENAKPSGYHTVTFTINKVDGQDPAHFVAGEKTVYYVKPNTDVTINPPKTVAETGYKFKEWSPDTATPTKYTGDTEVKATFKKHADIIDGDQAKPDGYVTVTFVKGENGKSITGQTVYYVNPKAGKTLGDAEIKKPTVVADTGYIQKTIVEAGVKKPQWDTADGAEIKADITVKPVYEELKDVVPQFNDDGSENAKPEGYITVTFSTEDNGKVKGTTNTTKVLYLNPDKALALETFAPKVDPNTGYDFAGWDTQIAKRIQYSNGDTIKALYNDPGVISKKEVAGYVKVEFKADADTQNPARGTLKGTTEYWIKPGVGVKIPEPDVDPNVGYEFEKWDKDLKVTLAANSKTYVITAQYEELKDIVPKQNYYETDKPKGYVRVEFDKGDHGKEITGQTVYYVNPNKTVTLTAPKVTAETGWKQKAGTEAWDKALTQQFKQDATIKAEYEERKDVIEKTKNDDSEKPAGYVTVKLIPTDKATDATKAEKTYFVNPNKSVTIPSTEPVGKEITDANNEKLYTYLFKGWVVTRGTITNPWLKPANGNAVITGTFAQNTEISAIYNVKAEKVDNGPRAKENVVTKKGVTPKAEDLIANKYDANDPNNAGNLPNGTKFEYETAPDVSKAGNIIAKVKVTYPNGKSLVVDVPIRVTDDNPPYDPQSVIPFDPSNLDDPSNPIKRPKDYIKVTFEADAGIKITEQKAYYVKKNLKDADGNSIKVGVLPKPTYEVAQGYAFEKWDDENTVIGESDIKLVAKARRTYQESLPNDRPDYRPEYETRYRYRDRIVEKEKIVEKIVKVGSDDMLKEIRYMQGFEGKFRPYDGLRRCEAAQILANALKADGYRYNEHYALSYTDVGNEWYTDAIRVVTQAGVFAGYNDGTFKPNGKITRAEWISTLRRFQNLRVEAGNLMNLKPGHWASGEVGAALMAGWLEIYVNGTVKFDADAPITRQEVAAVSNKAFRRVLDKVYLRRSVNTLLNYKDINPSMPLYEDILCASNTLLTDGRYYKANTIVMDNVTFNIVTDLLKITQKKFQYNGLR